MTIEEYAMAVAEAILLDCASRWQLPFTRSHIHLAHGDLRAVIEAIPEPEPLPAPDVQALRGQIEAEVWEARKKHEAALAAENADVRAQIDAAVKAAVAPWLEEEKLWREELDAAVAREREEICDLMQEFAFAETADVNVSLALAWLRNKIRARSGAKG